MQFALMDGEHTTFADNEFDAVLCSYGIFFLPDMASGITEWKRVTKPGGWVCFSAFGETAFQPQSDLFEQRIRHSARSFLTGSVLLAGKGWWSPRHWSPSSTRPA